MGGIETRSARYARGKSLRRQVPREQHADYSLDKARDPSKILNRADRGRLPELLPVRYQRMTTSPFAFFRGSAALMAADLAFAPRPGINVQACGDCHLLNFGVFATPEGRVLFDINDFDETLAGVDFTVDLKRLVASIAIAALDAGNSDKKAQAVARSAAHAYRCYMTELATLTPLKVWQTRMDVARETQRIDDAKIRRQIFKTLKLAEEKQQTDESFPQLVSAKGGVLKIADRPPLIYHLEQHADAQHGLDASAIFASYYASLAAERRLLAERYTLVDVAFRVGGIGSVGNFCAIGLFTTADDEHLFLQLKQARTSVLDHIATTSDQKRHQGQRVVEGQRILQAASDIFLSAVRDETAERDFYVRHLKNRRLASIGDLIESTALAAYADLCGRTLARAHARSGDPAVLAGYMGRSEVFDEALASFAMTYAEQSRRDHARLVKAQKAMSVTAAQTH